MKRAKIKKVSFVGKDKVDETGFEYSLWRINFESGQVNLGKEYNGHAVKKITHYLAKKGLLTANMHIALPVDVEEVKPEDISVYIMTDEEGNIKQGEIKTILYGPEGGYVTFLTEKEVTETIEFSGIEIDTQN